MSQPTATPVRVSAPPPGPVPRLRPVSGLSPSQRAQRVVKAVREAASHTPGRMRLVATGMAVASVLAGLVAGWGLSHQSAQWSSIAELSAHRILVQNVRTALVQADADVTNAFLKGGLEPVEQRTDYRRSIDAAAKNIALASATTPAEAATLGRVNQDLARYVGYIEQARANNRQLKPVGADYLKTASALLREPRTGILAGLDDVAAADQQRIQDTRTLTFTGPLLAFLALLGGAGALVAGQYWLAQRVHRYVNLPAAIGTVLFVVVLGAVAVLGALAGSGANAAYRNDYATADALSRARVAAFDAKANGSLTLIARGSGQEYQDAWETSIRESQKLLAAPGSQDALAALKAYGESHAAIRVQDAEKGNWEAAVALATATGPDSANGHFGDFAQLSRDHLQQLVAKANSGFANSTTWLGLLAALAVLAGLGAAVAAWQGVAQRIEEYR